MAAQRRLLCVLAHPGDEALLLGGALAHYAAAGVATYLLVATRGERGWPGTPEEYPGPFALGQLREAELRAAAAGLGTRAVEFLDYLDGDLQRADPQEAIGQIAALVRQLRPQVVVTLPPDGDPDRVAIGQFTLAALMHAADPDYRTPDGAAPHRVTKLYYVVGAHIAPWADGGHQECERPGWAITTRVDATAHWRQVWRAIGCHQTQWPILQPLASLPPDHHRDCWGAQAFYRVFSLTASREATESDLFSDIA